MKKLMIVLSSVSLVLLTAVPSFAQDSLNVRRLGFLRMWDHAFGVAVSGNYAYLAAACELAVVNIMNPAAPFQVGFCDGPRQPCGVAVAGIYAYIADGVGLRVVNVMDPSAPYEVGYYYTPAFATDVAVSGNYAYVADEGSGLRVVNITNPSNPVEVGFCDMPGWAYNVAVAGNYAYVTVTSDSQNYYNALRVVNIANPAAPFQTGLHVTDTPGYPLGVAVAGNYAYLADGGNGLRVVNITNPSSPVEVGFCDTPAAYRVAVSGNYAYVADTYSGLRVVNISNPTAPFEVGFYDTPMQAWDVAVSGNLAYVADFDYFGIYDCSAATTVPEAGHVVIPARFALHAPFPNPFNPATNIVFDLPEPGSVTVKVFDLMGREVAVLVNGERPAGQHTIRFDARDLPSGMYICRMTANEFTASHKMMLIR